MSEEKKTVFEKLNDINVNDKVKSKVGLSYLSWAYAWGELKKVYPNSDWTVYHRTIKTTKTQTIRDADGVETTITETFENEVPYFTDGKTCFVKVGVTIEGHEEIEELPVMDNRNNSVPLVSVTMTAVNRAIQRAFVKALARQGLGLYIYAGEDIPEVEKKVIDYKAIADNCERYQVVTLNETGFEIMKKDVINMVQASYPEDASKAIVDYVTKITNGKRLSMFTLADDNQNLQRIYNFINEVKKQLAAPSGK